MQRRMRFRMIVFICFIVAMMAVFALRLYKLQTTELVAADADSMTYRTTMEAATSSTGTATSSSRTARAITS